MAAPTFRRVHPPEGAWRLVLASVGVVIVSGMALDAWRSAAPRDEAPPSVRSQVAEGGPVALGPLAVGATWVEVEARLPSGVTRRDDVAVGTLRLADGALWKVHATFVEGRVVEVGGWHEADGAASAARRLRALIDAHPEPPTHPLGVGMPPTRSRILLDEHAAWTPIGGTTLVLGRVAHEVVVVSVGR